MENSSAWQEKIGMEKVKLKFFILARLRRLWMLEAKKHLDFTMEAIDR